MLQQFQEYTMQCVQLITVLYLHFPYLFQVISDMCCSDV